MYLKKYEPEFWAEYNTANREGREIIEKPVVKYAYFSNYFASNFNISFAQGQIDVKLVMNYISLSKMKQMVKKNHH